MKTQRHSSTIRLKSCPIPPPPPGFAAAAAGSGLGPNGDENACRSRARIVGRPLPVLVRDAPASSSSRRGNVRSISTARPLGTSVAFSETASLMSSAPSPGRMRGGPRPGRGCARRRASRSAARPRPAAGRRRRATGLPTPGGRGSRCPSTRSRPGARGTTRLEEISVAEPRRALWRDRQSARRVERRTRYARPGSSGRRRGSGPTDGRGVPAACRAAAAPSSARARRGPVAPADGPHPRPTAPRTSTGTRRRAPQPRPAAPRPPSSGGRARARSS